MSHVGNKGNTYARQMGADLFDRMPKAVIAACLVSYAGMGSDDMGNVRGRIIHEWWTLYHNQIVPQRPPFPDDFYT